MASRKKKSIAKKRVHKKKTKSSKFLLYTVWVLTLFAVALLALLGGYYLGKNKSESTQQQESSTHKELPRVKTEKKADVKKRLEAVLKKERQQYDSAAHEIESEALAVVKPKRETKSASHATKSKKPKLVIIIDDVSTRSQVAAIKSVGLPLSMSFLPPSSARPNSAKLAAKEPFYMVHLPMEALHFFKEEPYTLRAGDSKEQIEQRVSKIIRLFPRVHYINNHTGSKFTSDKRAMEYLVAVLQAHHIRFIDSRTTAKTKAPEVMREHGLRYMARDVFLDHHQEKAYVLKQIRQAVKVAKAHGYAIAIGHPHKNTLQALKESRGFLNKEVDVVLIKAL